MKVRPLARAIPIFLLGIWIGLDEHHLTSDLLIVWAVLLLVFAGFVFSRKGWLSYPRRWMIGATAFPLLFITGFLIGQLDNQRLSLHHFSNYKSDSILGTVSEPFVHKGANYRGVVEVHLMQRPDTLMAVSGKLMVYFPDSVDTLPEIGDLIYLHGNYQEAAEVKYPGQFDFRQWLAWKQIYHILRLRSSDYKIIQRRTGVSLNASIHHFRERLIELYRKAGLSGNELGVVSSLVLGDDHEVDNELVAAFSASGTLHILSVSGMHVALVYAVVAGIFSRILGGRQRRWYRTFAVLLFLLFYALLTGFSPAVQRAAVMLSLIIIGKTVSKAADTWNLLAGSLLLLVAVQPTLLRECGFQLSYAAVAGIIGFYPWLYERGGTMNRVGDTLWKSSCVALSAQWFTFPLALYHFHQFPNYFLPANLIIIPWSTLVLFGGIILLLVSPFAVLLQVVGAVVRWICHWLNWTVFLFQGLPNAQITGIWMSGLDVLLLILFVSFVTFFLVRRTNSYLFWALSLLCAFCFSFIVDYYVKSKEVKRIYWKQRKGSGVTQVIGHSALTILDSTLLMDQRWQEKSLRPALEALSVANARIIHYRTNEGIRQLKKPMLYVRQTIILPDTAISLKGFFSSHTHINNRVVKSD